MKLKKMIAIFMILIFSIPVMAGCSSNKEEKNEKVKNSKKPTTISFYVPGYGDKIYKDAYEQGIQAFEKANPDVKVKVIAVGWDESFQKMMSMIQAEEAPDVMVMGSIRLNQMSRMKAIEPLDKYISEERKSQYIEALYKTGNVNGKQYGLPMAFSSRALFYRKDLIKNPPKTWDELVKVSKEVQKKDPNIKGIGIPGAMNGSTETQLFNFFYQNGAKAFDDKGNPVINSKEGVEALQFYTDLYKKHKVTPNPVEVKRDNLYDLFKNGQIAMYVCGPWSKKVMGIEPDNQKTPYGVALLPKGKSMGESLVTDSLTISSQSKHKEEAARFIEFITRYEYQNKYDEIIGFFPLYKKEMEESRYKTEFLKPFVEMIQYGQPIPNPPVWEEFEETIVKATQKVLLGESTAKQALDEVQIKLEQSVRK